MSRALVLVLVAASLALAACVTTTEGERRESPEEAAELNVQLGVQYLRQNKLQLAMEKFTKALEQNPQLATAHTYTALLYERLGDPAKAESHYRRALRLDGDDPSAMNNYGAFLCRNDRPREAERYFLAATADPLYATPEAAWTNAGVCALRLEDEDRAEQYFRRALAAQPKFPDALWQMASLSFRRELFLQARAFLQRFEAAVPAPPAETLWLGVQIERELGDAPAAQAYAQRLKQDYPDSVETRLLLESERDGGEI